MKLTNESAKTIKLGNVIKFSWDDEIAGITLSMTGVVYANDESGIRCKRERFGSFVFRPQMFDGKIDFEILTEHPPVAIFNGEFDYVNKRI